MVIASDRRPRRKVGQRAAIGVGVVLSAAAFMAAGAAGFTTSRTSPQAVSAGAAGRPDPPAANADANAPVVASSTAGPPGSTSTPGSTGTPGASTSRPSGPTTTVVATTAPGAALPAVSGPVTAPVDPEVAAANAPADDRRLFLLGDSIIDSLDATDYGRTVLEKQLGWDITIDAKIGRFAEEGPARVRAHKKDLGQVAVVMLGNNYHGDPVDYRDQMEKVMTELAPVDHVYLCLVEEFRPDRQQVNEVLRAMAAAHPKVRLIDWNTVIGGQKGLNGDDGLHLTPAGAMALAQTIGTALGPAPGAQVDGANLPLDPVPAATTTSTTTSATTDRG